MHPSDAICVNDLCDDGDERPVYYCDRCGLELSYPAESGMHLQCELAAEDEQAGKVGVE